MMVKSMMKQESKISFNIKGVGVSLIDNEPKEILFVSVYKLAFSISKVSPTALNFDRAISSNRKMGKLKAWMQ
jgi:hypothetical protein